MAVSMLVPEYVAFSQELPPGSKSIWEIVEADLEHFASSQVDGGENRLVALVEFLNRFFCREVVDNVVKHIKALEGSTLGAEYTLGKPFALLAQSVVDGIRELATSSAPSAQKAAATSSLTGAQKSVAGHCQEHRQEQQQRQNQQRQGQRQEQLEQENPAFYAGGSSNAGGSASSGNGEEEEWPAIEYKERQKEVFLGRWSTPPRGSKDRGLTIRERSEEFLAIVKPTRGLLYDIHYGTVSLYHGTRAAQLASFAYEGIHPRVRVNEFWEGPAFYTCNSVQYAYEFPLHYHLGQGTDDSIAVLEFKVDAAVLNGEAAPFPGESKFRVKWFPSADERWERWVAYHMLPSEHRRLKLRKEDFKSWDIVIGPVCFGGPSADGKVAPVHLKTAGVNLIQAAFCSPRAQAWLQKKFSQVFMERRCG